MTNCGFCENGKFGEHDEQETDDYVVDSLQRAFGMASEVEWRILWLSYHGN